MVGGARGVYLVDLQAPVGHRGVNEKWMGQAKRYVSLASPDCLIPSLRGRNVEFASNDVVIE